MIDKNIRRQRRHSTPGGWLLLDVMSGLLLLLVTLALLGSVLGRSRITAARLADDRAAVRLAEAALLTLSTNSDAIIDSRVTITPLEAPSVDGRRWTSATATISGRHATLIGLIAHSRPATLPASSSPAEEGTP